jgi:hypothetical protein
VQRVALVEGGADVRALVADAAAGEGACARLDLGAEGRGRDREDADKSEKGGDNLFYVLVSLSCIRSHGKRILVFLTRTILTMG